MASPEPKAPNPGLQTMFRETIFALSSGGLPSGLAVVRLSGPGTAAALQSVAGPLPPARRAVLRRIRDATGAEIDRGIVLYFPGPGSVTGEDCGEIHLHGGRAVVAAMLAALAERPGLRMAEAGEFTRRAFVNGRMDLAQAEALSDLIAAETEAQRRLALTGVDGAHGRIYRGWMERLTQARAAIEAELDFFDEGDVDEGLSAPALAGLEAVRREIEAHLAGGRAAEIVREGFRVAIMGPPNAGKSSLLNALAAREVAIVTDVPGTTRDPVEIVLDIEGLKVVVTDTAGLRERAGKVERIGIERAREAGRAADLILWLSETGAPPADGDLASAAAERTVVIRTKSDLVRPRAENGSPIAISTVTGTGLRRLTELIHEKAASATRHEGLLPQRARHRHVLAEAAQCIGKAIEGDPALELRAEELRRAAVSLGRITGAVDVEDLLGHIFGRFCIGK